jgi:hypothetical protein
MVLLNNDIETTNYFNQIFQKALDLTMEEFLASLKDWIDADVYSWVSPSLNPWSLYRTFQFKDSWEKTKSEIIGSIVESEIFQNISVMQQFNSGDYGNILVHEDAENLAEIINSGNDYNFGYAEGNSRTYWDDFKKEVDAKLDITFINNCRKLGVDIK